ncbi:MAG: hypothetical protein M1837_007344 [Sclerophora amabilis]|nr:MAG: hypothetical protein M1837_007344 [Sclerophora amabilis]
MSAPVLPSQPILQIPTVSETDLREFQLIHFSSTASPTVVTGKGLSAPDADDSENKYWYWGEDDGLGYYQDGVKRTLTAEQVAMFRHSEIQSLLKEKRRRLEREQSAEIQVGVVREPAGGLTEEDEEGEVSDDQNDVDVDVDELEYAAFLKRERQDFLATNDTPSQSFEADMEEAKAAQLDYGDEPSAATSSEGHEQREDLFQTRKQVSYADADNVEVLAFDIYHYPHAAIEKLGRPKAVGGKKFLWPKIG